MIVDDGSTDDTPAVLDEYADTITVLRHENGKRGCAASLNAAVRKAKGDDIAFLDHDDIWPDLNLPDKASLLDDRPDVAMVYSN